ncbi:hypothetical protein CUN59_11575 [Cuspidothrix issatschenkoi CHARLIE-1]|uniref:Uncharacterized protein n=1 Tax=Cuspidothrix issatschenkoi CHARLIE-1 TaxID=2052836 RepID=A0A2S6CTS1_9CYAN|nr:hypothetical protein CUN59_11575 [Cuspidothrix issatschenkoi CHARLIE-1]
MIVIKGIHFIPVMMVRFSQEFKLIKFYIDIPPFCGFNNDEFMAVKTEKIPHGIFKNLWG